MNIITSDLQSDMGKVVINGERLHLKNLKTFYDSVAFCPQHNPLWDELTLFEHLELYAAIKGVPKKKVRDECKE